MTILIYELVEMTLDVMKITGITYTYKLLELGNQKRGRA